MQGKETDGCKARYMAWQTRISVATCELNTNHATSDPSIWTAKVSPASSPGVLCVAKLLAGVHGERACALAEADALGAVPAAVAGLAEELLLVLGAVRRVEELLAHC